MMTLVGLPSAKACDRSWWQCVTLQIYVCTFPVLLIQTIDRIFPILSNTQSTGLCQDYTGHHLHASIAVRRCDGSIHPNPNPNPIAAPHPPPPSPDVLFSTPIEVTFPTTFQVDLLNIRDCHTQSDTEAPNRPVPPLFSRTVTRAFQAMAPAKHATLEAYRCCSSVTWDVSMADEDEDIWSPSATYRCRNAVIE